MGLVAAGALHASPAAITSQIAIDQFGYLPNATKIAVIGNPKQGFDAGNAYVPGATLQLRNWGDDTVVFSGPAQSWNGGATDSISGNQCWWFDFSSVTAGGRYYVWDPANGKGSGAIQIGPDIYRNAAIQAMRMFFYQRCAQAKQPPYAAPQWSDAASFVGPNQDTACRLVTDPANAATALDLHGGWSDAGDYNKYTNFARSAVQNLLLAYEDHPTVWGEDHGIPESGNGIPDILNEAKWEIDWLLRMQQPDGSLLSKVGAMGYDSGCPPSTDTAARYYGAASTSSTLTGADIFAHAAIVFGSLNQPAATAYAATLRTAAINAWNWAAANPSVIYDNAGFDSADPETDTTPAEHAVSAARAACMLFALTGDTAYRDAFDANYTQASVFTNPYYLSPYDTDVDSALLYYLRLPGGTASVQSAISQAFLTGVSQFSDFLPAATNATDPYRAYLASGDYVWGSDQIKSAKGGLFLWIHQLGLDPANGNAYLEAAAGFLHYLHGTNPLGMTFLSNMGTVGATKSATQFYHSWFGAGPYSSALAAPDLPAPGYLTGGADVYYAPDPSYAGPAIAPPMNQPAMKSYLNWNLGFPQDSWEVTEPDISYEAVYIRLLAAFLAPDTTTIPTARLVNLSARAGVTGTGANAQNLVAGFVIGGSAPKNMLIRGVGPGLTPFNVPDALAQPELTLYDGTPEVVATQAGWADAPQAGASLLAAGIVPATVVNFSQLGAFALPVGSADCAVIAPLPAGSYSSQVSGLNNSTGVALAELYDADAPSATSRLLNISARAFTGGGAQTLTAGFVVSGSTAESVLLRGIGPTLAAFGVSGALPTPVLVLYDGTGQIIATDAGWGNPVSLGPSSMASAAAVQPATASIMSSVGAFALPSGSADCAMTATLPAGSYTAAVQGDGSSGIALVEIYELPSSN